jgi:NADH-quinone oxidoreductase subunit J
MDIERILFYVFAAILVFAAARVITVRNPVHAALHLVLAFFTCAGLWLLLEAEFLAITLVLVYVGAVMVLFLFVVMMLDINTSPLGEGFVKYLPMGVTVALLIFAEMGLVVGAKHFGSDVVAIPARSTSVVTWLRFRRAIRRATAMCANWVVCCIPTTCTRSRLPR